MSSTVHEGRPQTILASSPAGTGAGPGDDLQHLSLRHLRLIKWIPQGHTTEKKLKIAAAMAPKWRDVAILLGLDQAQIAAIKTPGIEKTTEQCLYDVITKWQEMDQDASKEKYYSFSWKGLLALLGDAELSVLASEVCNALDSDVSSIRVNEFTPLPATPRSLSTGSDGSRSLSETDSKLGLEKFFSLPVYGTTDTLNDDPISSDHSVLNQLQKRDVTTLLQCISEENIMDPHDSYHLDIQSSEAEQILRRSGDHCYLTRFSRSNQCYVLSVYQKHPYTKMMTFPIEFNDSNEGRRKYRIRGKDMKFDSLDKMLKHYEDNQIDPGLLSIGRQVTRDESTSYLENQTPNGSSGVEVLHQQTGQLCSHCGQANPPPQLQTPQPRKVCLIF